MLTLLMRGACLSILALAACSGSDDTMDASAESDAAMVLDAGTEDASVGNDLSSTDDASANPYGVFVAQAEGRAFTPDQKVDIALSLHVSRMRTSVNTVSFTTLPVGLQEFLTRGMKVVPTISYQPDGVNDVKPPDLVAYATAIGNVVDAMSPRPELVVIANEENFSHYLGSPTDYLAQLDAAIPAAHAHGTKITNGGLESERIAWATYANLLATSTTAIAKQYSLDVFGANEPPGYHNPDMGVATDVDDIDTLLAGYKVRNLDYVNIHWYHKGAPGLAQTVAFVHAATGKIVITNEIGQHDSDATQVTDTLKETYALSMPLVIWFCGDGTAGAESLVIVDGGLKDSGIAFRDFIDSHYP